MPQGGARRGAGRPPSIPDGVRLVIVLPGEMVKRLDEVAKRQRIARTEAIRRAIEKGLSR
jgi:metal-responsive CopG/Arc/MetJ family transcriptional regulator